MTEHCTPDFYLLDVADAVIVAAHWDQRCTQAMVETRYDPAADVPHVTFGAADAAYDNTKEVVPGRMSRSTRRATRRA